MLRLHVRCLVGGFLAAVALTTLSATTVLNAGETQTEDAGETQTEETYRSHPPLRKNPPPSQRPLAEGPTFFVDAKRGSDANDGGKTSPWKTVNQALSQLKAGDTLYLRGGTFYENVYLSLVGTKESPITIRGYPGEEVIIDGGLREFAENPADCWEPLPGGGEGEYRSTRPYRNIRDVVGAFGDSNIGLQTYWHLIDLRAENGLTGPGEGGDIKPLYCGPGLYYDRQTGFIHARLAHTHLEGYDNYRGETDPRRLPLIVAPFRSVPLHVDQAKHVRIEDLVIRGGGYETVVVTYGVDVTFDNVTIRGGTYCMRTENTGPFRFYRSAMYGNAPPWTFRGDGSLRARPGRNTRDIARLTCHALWVTNTGREFSVYAYPMNDDWEVSHSEFTDSHDGLYLGGIGLRFHHNLVDNFQDDGIYLSQMYPRHLFMGGGAEIHISQNLFTRCLTSLAFGGFWDTKDRVLIYRNIFDLRGGVHYGRPSVTNPRKETSPGRVMSDHGSPPWPAMTIYHNTFVMRGGTRAAGMNTLTARKGNYPRRTFNNVFLHLARIPGYRGPDAELNVHGDGNLFFSPLAVEPDSQSPALSESFFKRYRSSEAFRASQAVYPGGFSSRSLFADPKFTSVQSDWRAANDYRLRPDSPAIDAGAAIPEDWPDPLRDRDKGRPDIGALPAGEKQPVFGRTTVSLEGN